MIDRAVLDYWNKKQETHQCDVPVSVIKVNLYREEIAK